MEPLGLRADAWALVIVLAALASCTGGSGPETGSGGSGTPIGNGPASGGASAESGAESGGGGAESGTPIVFVHGSGHSDASWRAMRRHLARLGYRPGQLVAVEIPPARSANDVAAREVIAPAVERALAGSSSQPSGQVVSKVDLVAHSMGAVSSRYVAAVLRPERVRTWIAIAGSNHGTDALCHSSLPGDRQMCPAFARTADESALQARLNGVPGAPRDQTPYGIGGDLSVPSIPADAARCIAYFTIRIEPDEWIEPAASAKLAGSGGIEVELAGLPFIETEPGNFLLTERAGHDLLPEQPHVIELVARILAAVEREGAKRCDIAAARAVN